MDLYSFLQKNTFYVVLIITLIIWLGIFLYMFTLNKKVSALEKQNS